MSKNYKLGKGKVFIDLLDANGDSIEGERYMGNTPGFTVSPESENLDHFSAEEGIGEKDDQALQDLTRTVNITFDNMVLENLALFITGDLSKVTKSSAPITAEPHTVKQGRYYQLGQDASNPSGVRGISAVTVNESGGTPTYVEDTDYTVDLATGRLFIIEGGGISDDTSLEVDYTQDAVEWEQVASSALASKDAAIRFIASNPKGTNDDMYIPKASVRPSGELALKGTDWQQAQLECEVLKKTGLAAVYIDGRAVSTA